MKNSQTLKKSYFDWLFQQYNYDDLDNDIVKINTPFLDNEFDNIIMYVEFLNDGKINLTDDGWTMNGLKNNGVSFSRKTTLRNKLLKDITENLGIDLVGNELSIKTDLDKFPIAKQRLLQGIMQVNDLIVLEKSNIRKIFFEEVQDFFSDHHILFSSKPSFAGKGGITVQFDFLIPTDKDEKLIRTISNGNNLNHSKLLTVDTQLLKSTRKNSEYYALFDDISHPISNLQDVNTIFNENSSANIIPVNFSQLKKQPELLSNKA